jgi:hypothetical protein
MGTDETPMRKSSGKFAPIAEMKTSAFINDNICWKTTCGQRNLKAMKSDRLQKPTTFRVRVEQI